MTSKKKKKNGHRCPIYQHTSRRKRQEVASSVTTVEPATCGWLTLTRLTARSPPPPPFSVSLQSATFVANSFRRDSIIHSPVDRTTIIAPLTPRKQQRPAAAAGAGAAAPSLPRGAGRGRGLSAAAASHPGPASVISPQLHYYDDLNNSFTLHILKMSTPTTMPMNPLLHSRGALHAAGLLPPPPPLHQTLQTR